MTNGTIGNKHSAHAHLLRTRRSPLQLINEWVNAPAPSRSVSSILTPELPSASQPCRARRSCIYKRVPCTCHLRHKFPFVPSQCLTCSTFFSLLSLSLPQPPWLHIQMSPSSSMNSPARLQLEDSPFAARNLLVRPSLRLMNSRMPCV